MPERVFLAANNPDLGGGERMLLRCAVALRELGHEPVVVSADHPDDVLTAAAGLGLATVAVRARGRGDYLHRLRSWDARERSGLLWCHGLVPALATAARADRVVHLHQEPRSTAQRVALGLARGRSRAVLTPSAYLADRVGLGTAMPNWTDDLPLLPRPTPTERLRVGFLGRLSQDKGLDVLAHALDHVARRTGRRVELVVAGDQRYVPQVQVRAVDAALARTRADVVQLGHVRLEAFCDAVDLAVFPSVWPESFGLVVAEAMASGVPFVVSDAGALPEVAGPDHPWVARAGDVQDLADVIERAAGAHPDEIGEATTRSRRRWENCYSPAAGRDRVRALMEGLDIS